METRLGRVFFLELIGAFGLVLFTAGLACVNQMTTPEGQTSPALLTAQQPGAFGVALGQGLILAALLAITAPITGGYLNPAIVIMLWVMGRIDNRRAAVLGIAQIAGSALAALCLQLMFVDAVLKPAHHGAPHLSNLVYRQELAGTLVAGSAVELTLTFFLVFAIFALATGDSLRLGIVAGMIATASSLFGYPLTGACMNPARWLGPTMFEAFHSTSFAWSHTVIYLAGPILGALAGGLAAFKLVEKKTQN
jgi:glycerol uptake facilitator-like aquaporin